MFLARKVLHFCDYSRIVGKTLRARCVRLLFQRTRWCRTVCTVSADRSTSATDSLQWRRPTMNTTPGRTTIRLSGRTASMSWIYFVYSINPSIRPSNNHNNNNNNNNTTIYKAVTWLESGVQEPTSEQFSMMSTLHTTLFVVLLHQWRFIKIPV